MVAAQLSTSRSLPARRVYPPPWNTTSTLPAATPGKYLYDYAGQDPINGYDLNGTMHAEGNICGSLSGKAFTGCVHLRWGMTAYCDAGSPYRVSKACALYWWTFYPDKVKPWMEKWIPHSGSCSKAHEYFDAFASLLAPGWWKAPFVIDGLACISR